MKTDVSMLASTEDTVACSLKKNSAKQNQNASGKISYVVRKVLLPLTIAPIGDCISFKPKQEEDITRCFVEDLVALRSGSIADKHTFVQSMSDLYEKHLKHSPHGDL